MVVKVQESNIITITDLPNEIIESKNNKQHHNNTPNHNYAKYEQSLLTSQNDSKNNIQPLKDQELKTILKVLDAVNGNVQEAAKRLGIHRSTLYRKLPRLKNFKEM
jgi:transcriptional regulator of acetoin/glycerol metabolism